MSQEANLDDPDIIFVDPDDSGGGEAAEEAGGASPAAGADGGASGDGVDNSASPPASSSCESVSKGKRPRLSPVWKHFEQTATNQRYVQCKHCPKKVRILSTTSSA